MRKVERNFTVPQTSEHRMAFPHLSFPVTQASNATAVRALAEEFPTNFCVLPTSLAAVTHVCGFSLQQHNILGKSADLTLQPAHITKLLRGV
jgi:hypothetical protein